MHDTPGMRADLTNALPVDMLASQATEEPMKGNIMATKTLPLPRLTADAHRAEAQAASAEERASFERCDTDGFVSQWANNRMASYHRMSADLAEAGGKAEHTALFHLDGTVASTHQAEGQYGPFWVLNDAAAERFGKRFVTLSKARNGERRYAANRAKGFTVGTILVDSYTDMVGNGRGLGAALTVRTVVKPSVEALRKGDYTIVTTDRGVGSDY